MMVGTIAMMLGSESRLSAVSTRLHWHTSLLSSAVWPMQILESSFDQQKWQHLSFHN